MPADGLTTLHMVLLGGLRNGHVATPDDLAERLGLDVGRVVALLDDLVRGGYMRLAATREDSGERASERHWPKDQCVRLPVGIRDPR